MKNAKIRTKIMIGYFIAIALSVLIGVIGIVTSNTSADNTNLLNDRLSEALDSSNLETNLNQQQAAYRGTALTILSRIRSVSSATAGCWKV